MIGLVFIYFIGKAFYELASENNKHKWGFTILGIISYYAGTFIGGIVLVIIGLIMNSNFMSETNNTTLNIVAIPFGLLCCWSFYKILQRNWSSSNKSNENDSLDGDFMNNA